MTYQMIVDRSTAMPKRADTRQILLNEGRKALLTCGYDGVGIGAILAAAGVPKGSFYYFFESKESFAEAVLDDYERHYINLRNQYFDDASRSPLERIRAYFDALETLHLGETPLGGCLFGVMAQTASIRGSAFRLRLASIFNTWTGQIERVLVQARDAGEISAEADPRTAAAFLIDAYEGALIRMKADGDSTSFSRFRQYALGSLER